MTRELQINLAIQRGDAVAAASVLASPLSAGRVTTDQLRRVQKLPTRVTQRIQVALQERIIRQVLSGTRPVRPPLALRLLARFPVLRRIPARLVGMGIRPEHVRTPAVPGA